jgi:hypothetical protein
MRQFLPLSEKERRVTGRGRQELPARYALVVGEDPALSGNEPAPYVTHSSEDPALSGNEPAQRTTPRV